MKNSLYTNRLLVYPPLGLLMAIMVIQGLPAWSTFHEQLKRISERVTTPLGIDQSSWKLYAPMPTVNTRLSATVLWADGTESEWQTPAWSEMSVLDKLLNDRWANYYGILSDDPGFLRCYPALALYVANSSATEQRPTASRVELFLSVDQIEPPAKTWRMARSPPQFTEKHSMFTFWLQHE